MTDTIGTTDAIHAIDAIETVLRPRSVVVVGASPHGRGFTSAPLKNLKRHGFAGTVSAVNPKYQEIDDVPCFASVSEIPETPDTAVVVVGAERVPAALRDCAESGVRTATVIAGGFAELGVRGEELRQEIRAICDQTGLRLVGPNTAGLMNVVDSYVPRAGLNHAEHLTVGSIAIATQSGALCNTVLNRAQAYGGGFAMAVATGSQWDLDLWDFVDYFLAEDRINAVATIPEGIHDVEKFLRVADRATRVGKPIILLKPGRSEVGSRAIQTHSGALAGAADVQVSILREHGIVVVDDLDELWETGQLFECWASSRPVDDVTGRLGVLTYSGGDGALAVDAAEAAGLVCPEPGAETAARLAELFELATPGNPFDYTGEVVGKPELIAPATTAVMDDDAYNAVLIAAPVWSGHFAEWIVGPAVDAAAAHAKPAAVSLWSAGELTAEARNVARRSGLPLFDGSHRAATAIGRYFEFHRNRRRHLERSAPGPGSVPRRPGSAQILDYWESRGALAASGVPFNEATVVGSGAEAVQAAERIGFPVTLKASAPSAVHKVAAGGVRLFVSDADSLRREADEMLARFPDGRLIVEKFVPGVATALVGGHCDPDFGPVVVFGLGGGYAETYRDVAHLQCPATESQVAAALASTAFGRMLGPQSRTHADLAAMIARASQWFAGDQDVIGFDVNPVLVGLDGDLVAVDARVERVG